MNKIILSFVVIGAVSTGVFAAGSGDSLRDKQSQSSTGIKKSCDGAKFVVTAANAIDGAVRSGSPAKFSAVAGQYLDMRSIGLAALGRFRKELPKPREAEYIALTSGFLGRFALEHANRFRTANIAVVSCLEQPTQVTVTAKMASGQKIVARLAKTSSSYRIIDINLESVWLVEQMRSAFVGTIRRDGIDALFKFLKT